MKAFISYSHTDEAAVEDLHKHLAMLKRSGAVEAWYDRDILAGGQLDSSIAANLHDSQLFFAIVSPDFINSNYCYDVEMTKAFELHEKGQLRIIPIIVEPCDWQNSPLEKLKAVPKDGKPVSDWTNKNTAWLDVVNEIRRVVSALSHNENAPSHTAPVTNSTATKKYRVQREFDSIDKSDFREQAFSMIRDYFQEAIAELDEIDGMKARFRRMSDIAFTCSIYNGMAANKEAHITVRIGGGHTSLGDISYSYQENDTGSSANGWLSVEADNYELYLAHFGSMGRSYEGAKKFTPKSAAQVLWQEFIEHAGVSYA